MSNVKIYSKRTQGNIKLSENFSVKEFACSDGTDTIKIDLDMIPVLQRFREYVEVGVTINSAYRTTSYNQKVGGASRSYHLFGQAFDLPFKTSYKYLTSIDKMCAFFNAIGVKGIIKYSWGVHIDTRTSKYHATSSGNLVSYGKVNIPYRNKVLLKGIENIDVGILQFKLNSLGYDCGDCDLKFGNNTEKAVKAFQRANGLNDDGKVGILTWTKLF